MFVLKVSAAKALDPAKRAAISSTDNFILQILPSVQLGVGLVHFGRKMEREKRKDGE
jgi:hypothetical protein